MKIYFLEKCCDISRAYLDTIDFVKPHEFTDDINEADIICIIGCGYTKLKIDDTLQTIDEILKTKKESVHLAVFGCPSLYEDFYNKVKKLPDVEYIGVGNGIKMQDEIENYLKTNFGEYNVLSNDIGCGFKTPYRVNLVVEDGCSHRCTFCKSNYLNLQLRSIPFNYLIEYIKYLTNYGLKEVNITGLNTTGYSYKNYRLLDIIRFLSDIPTIESIFIDSMCLENIDNELLSEILINRKIKRVMIPIQSMDDRMLKLMGRKYTTEDIMAIFNQISKCRSDIFLETIFMTTFPTETIENIKKNIHLLEKIRIHNPTLSVYESGKNVSSLASEKLLNMSEEDEYELLSYYVSFMIPVIDEQRKELLSKPLQGRLLYQVGDFEVYSTLYRFTMNDFIVKCEGKSGLDNGQQCLIQSEFVESQSDIIYLTNPEPTRGRILKKI